MPEFVFRTAMVRGIRTIKQDTRFLDSLFRNLDQQSASEMRDFMLKHTIYIDINYPREALKLPAIIILLKSERESQAYLGDSMGTQQLPQALSYDGYSDVEEELRDEILGGAATISALTGQGTIKYGPARVLSSTANVLKVADRVWNSSQWLAGDHTVHLIGGTGAGQKKTITANGEDTLMVDTNWQVIPDATTIFEIRDTPLETVGEPRAIYDRARGNFIERRGSLYALNYQIQVIGPNPEFTIYLHAMVKAIFTLSRLFLEQQGIINLQMGATDFLPRAEYQPDHAYMRALNVEFLYPFDIFEELGDLADSLRIVLEGCAPDGKVILSDSTC